MIIVQCDADQRRGSRGQGPGLMIHGPHSHDEHPSLSDMIIIISD